jgi:uncharacterized membrane protein YidH (DUF202 family)
MPTNEHSPLAATTEQQQGSAMQAAFSEESPSAADGRQEHVPVLHSLIVPRRQGGTLAVFAVAFASLGFALGELTGFSTAQGISQALLTAVFAFVGGVVLSYAGFRRLSDDGRMRLDAARVCSAVIGLAVGLAVGLPFGVYARCNRQLESFFLGEQLQHSQCVSGASSLAVMERRPDEHPPTALGVGVQSAATAACTRALQALSLAFDAPHDAAQLRELLSNTIKTCGLAAH